MANYLNQRKDKIYFPYEYGTGMYDQMREPIFGLLRREELEPKIYNIYKHLEDWGSYFLVQAVVSRGNFYVICLST